MKVLGLDLGVASVGGALLKLPDSYLDWGKNGEIIWAGSRIVPTDVEYLRKFESGTPAETKAGNRTKIRGSRRLKQRYILRRTRLINVLKVLKWIPENFPTNFKEKTRNEDAFKFNISDFLPFEKQSIEEASKFLGLENKKGELSCSEDWIVYYLRKKALTEKISLAELSRIIYMFNQRRGFKSGRKDLKDVSIDNIEKKRVEILTIESVEQITTEKDKNGKFKFKIIPNNSTAKQPVESWEVVKFKLPEWVGKEFTLLITVKGDKQLMPQIPTEDDFDLLVTALDNKIENSGKYVGEYFFDELAKNKDYKIRQQTVKRDQYKKELEAIWKKQAQFHLEITDKSKLQEIAATLYPSQTKAGLEKWKEITSNDIFHTIANDIIYYQRELKSQKSLISGCQYEKLHIVKKDGEKSVIGVKVAPKSSPDFQEFRIWQTIHNIKIFEKEQTVNGRLKVNVDITHQYLGNDTNGFEVKEKLFELFDNSGDVNEEKVFKTINEVRNTKLKNDKFRINLFFKKDTIVKGNETKYTFRKAFKTANIEIEGELILGNSKKFSTLWHIFYSITSSDIKISQKGIRNALKNPKNGFNLSDEAISSLVNIPEKIQQYGSLSTKAIKKMLPIMRCGKYWNWEDIDSKYQTKIEDIIRNGWDIIDKNTGEVTGTELPFSEKNQVQGLPTYMAAYGNL